jgi:methionyl-tRNA formyltransferase
MYTVFYVGYDLKGLHSLIPNEQIHLLGVGEIEYLKQWSVNPCNWPFVWLYKTQFRKKRKPVSKFLVRVLENLKVFTTGAVRKYNEDVLYLNQNCIRVYHFDIQVEDIKKLEIDLLVVNVWEILTQEELGIARHGALNLHPSKLPQYRGAVPTLYSLKNKDPETALSYMILNQGMDTGGIIAQYLIPLTGSDDWYSLELKIRNLTIQTLASVIIGYLSGSMTPTPQNLQDASYTEKYEKYRVIRPNEETASDVLNKTYLYPYLEPGDYCYIDFKEFRIELRGGRLVGKSIAPGKITRRNFYLAIQAQDFLISCKLFVDVPFLSSIRALYYL